MTNSQSQTDPISTVPSDRLWLRSELMGTQVITRDSGRRLGLVGEVVVDIDRREVVALGLRDNPLTRFLPGLPRWMPLDRIRQVGDVILVDSIDSLSQAFSPDRYSKVINCQVITESGQQLGRVLGFSFDIETGELITLVMGALGVPLLGEGVLSTWEMPVNEIVSSGADRIIVYEGAEEKLKQLNSGFLEKLGVGGSSWEERERDRYRVDLVPVENQLTSGETFDDGQRLLEGSSQEIMREKEMEYVELVDKQKESANKLRYIDDPITNSDSLYSEYNEVRSNNDQIDDIDQSNIYESDATNRIRSNRRLIARNDEPMDIEPLDRLDSLDDYNKDQNTDFSSKSGEIKVADKNIEADNTEKNIIDIEDPW